MELMKAFWQVEFWEDFPHLSQSLVPAYRVKVKVSKGSEEVIPIFLDNLTKSKALTWFVCQVLGNFFKLKLSEEASALTKVEVTATNERKLIVSFIFYLLGVKDLKFEDGRWSKKSL